jgi:phage terminase Nu1 subunit (DNA packaging protein)
VLRENGDMTTSSKSALPETVSLADLRWLLGGVTTSHINGLTRDGILEKSDRGEYRLSSVPNYVKFMRKRGAAPTEWHRARTMLTKERAQITRLDRFEREKRSIPTSEVLAAWTAIAVVIRNRVLVIASKVAPRLIGIRTAAEVEAILRPECEEALEELSRMQVVNGRAADDEQDDEHDNV